MIRTRVVWTGVAGTPYYSNFYWRGSTGAQAIDAGEATSAWVEYFRGLAVTALTLTCESEAVFMDPATGQLQGTAAIPSLTLAGTDAGQPLPFQTQARTILRTGIIAGGRRINGASFLPGLAETIQSTGIGPEETIRGVIQEGYESTLLDTSVEYVVWSRKNGEMFNVTTVETSSVWSTLRSRRAI